MTALWTELASLCASTIAERKTAENLLAELLVHGHIEQTCQALLRLSDATIAHFYSCLGELRSAHSPVSNQPHSGWMADADFCFVNIRACGLNEKPGNFIQAAKLLPGLRANAIHLAPFTSYDFGVVYAVRSVRSISLRVVDESLANRGFSAGKQLRAFVEAAHLLGKLIGFDLEPHTAQFSITAAEHPELFRWLKIDPQGDSLVNGLSQTEQLSEPFQTQICSEISALVTASLRQQQLATLESLPDDKPGIVRQKEQTFAGLVKQFIDMGYWPLPCQVWSGDGVPAFDGYNIEGNYPRFLYLSRQGEDHSTQAYHILTPFRFNNDLLPNQASPNPPTNYEPGSRFLGEIFPYWRDQFGFDFVRYDSVDHIFDSLWQGDPTAAASDRPSPEVLQQCIDASRAGGKPYIGNMAERMGNEFDEYAGLGYDLMLGNDMLQRIDRPLMEKTFWIYDELCSLNRQRATRFSIPFCVDTHDTGNPHLWGEALVKVMGAERMRLRHFVSRFAHAGLARRPKYEVVGSQDLSYGLYQSNIREVNLNWVGDARYNNHYHHLENVYETWRDFLSRAEIICHGLDDRRAWWLLVQPGSAEHLLAVISLETGDGAQPEPFHLTLPIAEGCLIREEDFSGAAPRLFPFYGETLSITLSYLEFRLYTWN